MQSGDAWLDQVIIGTEYCSTTDCPGKIQIRWADQEVECPVCGRRYTAKMETWLEPVEPPKGGTDAPTL